METRNLYTNLPEQINRQIEQKTQVNDVNTQSVATTMQDGIEPLYVSQLNNSFDSNIPPAMPQIQWVTRFEAGKPLVEMTIIFSGKDKLGHDVTGQVIADIYRDKDNSGTFEDDEHIDSIDLQITNKFIDRDVPKDEVVRYKILLKNMANRQQTWSDPIIVSTSDNVTPYTPPVGVDPITGLDEIVVLTSSIDTASNGDNCNAILKIKQHDDDDFRMFEIQYKEKSTVIWSKQPNVLAGTALTSGYYYIPMLNLIRGTFYEVQVRAQRNSGNVSDWSTSIQFIAGDFVAPEKPENFYAVNISDSTNYILQLNWSVPLRYGNNGLKGFKIYRSEYNSSSDQYVDGTRTLLTDLDASAAPDMVSWSYIDGTVANKYYGYEIYAYDNSTAENSSAATWTYPVLAALIVDSSEITLTQTGSNFPVQVDWTYAGGYHGTYLAFRENHGEKRILFQKDFANTIKTYTITLQDFKEQDAKDFLNIDAWETTHNYSIEIGSVYNATNAGVRRARIASETLLINPKPADVQGFTTTYDPIRHQIDCKWTKNTDAFLTGYEIKKISQAQYDALLLIIGNTPTNITDRRAIWDSAERLNDTIRLGKDAQSYIWQLPSDIDPSPSSPIAYFFLIRAVGDFFVDYKYASTTLSKIVYSQESAVGTASVLQQLPAPTVVGSPTYSSAKLDGKVMRLNWTMSYGTADLQRQFKEFWLFMSTDPANLATVNIAYRAWVGPTNSAVIEKDETGTVLNYATQYYFMVVAVDFHDVPGVASQIFSNAPASTLAILPQASITGATVIRSLPVELNSFSETPINDSQLIDVYNTRSMQFTIQNEFTKGIYVDRIRWYISTSGGPYILATETRFDKETTNVSMLIPAGFKQAYSFPSDKVLFQVKAVQYRPDGTEGSLIATTASRYCKIDTATPNLDIQKIWYKEDNTIAINKNGYINKKILTNGIDIYYRAYEKDANSGINRVEYNYNNGITWTTATGSPINITNAMLGADTVDGVYKEFEVKIRAFDNAENSIEQVVRFKKDTVGPSSADLPTGLTWAFGRDIKLSWINPAKVSRNLYDGLKLFIGATLNTAKEYTLDSNPFIFKPTASPVQLYLAAYDIADNLTYLNEAGAVQVNPYLITITNTPPAAPANLRLNSMVGGAEVFWDAVTLDTSTPPRVEEVEKYWIQYAIAETEPAIGSGDWKFPGWSNPDPNNPKLYETFTTKINISLSATEMDLFTANTALKLWVRVDATDYWGARSVPSVANNVVPKNVTAVDMGNNIFKFKLSSDLTLTPYVGAVQTGSTEHILDANYLDNEFVTFTIASTTNNYVKIDLNKVEWISDIKLKFKHTTSNVRFVIKLEEITSTGTQDVWLQCLNSGDHTFNNAGDIVTSATKPDADRYFEYSTTGSGVADMALLHYENFSTGKAILAKSVTIYFYSPDSTVVNLVEFQPVITSIANIFYGSEINLDFLLSIRSKADASNYCYLTKSGLQIYQSNVNTFSATTTGVSIRNAVGNGRVEINSTAFNVFDASNVKKVELGYLDNATYGLWAKDNIYLGGTTCALSNLVVTPTAINLGYRTTNIYDTQISSGSITMCYSAAYSSHQFYLNSNYLLFRDATTAARQVMISGQSYLDGIGIGYVTYGGSKYYFDTIIQSGAVYLGYHAGYAEYHQSYNVKINATGVYLGHSGNVVSDVAHYRARILASGDIGLGIYVINGATTVYNTVLNGTDIKIGCVDYTNLYYNTKLTSSAIYLGHVSSGTTYKLSLTASEIAMLGYDNTAFFKVGQYQINNNNVNTIWAKRLLLCNASTDNPLTTDSENSKAVIVCTDAYSALLVTNTYSSAASSAIEGRTIYGVGGVVGGSYTQSNPTDENAGIPGVWGAGNTYSTGVKGTSTQWYAGHFASVSNHGIFATSSASGKYAVYGKNTTSGGNGIIGHITSGTGSATVGICESATGTAGYFSSLGAAIFAYGTVQFQNLSAAGTGTDLVIDANGFVKLKSSSIRYKDIISTIEDFSMDKFNCLTPYAYRFKQSGDYDIGFIAEDILNVFPSLVNFNNNGQPESLKYDRFSVYNVLATQQHESRIKILENMIIELKNKIDTLIKTE